MPMPSVTVISHYLPTAEADYQRLADLTLPNRDEYCARHGYKHLVHKGPYHNPDWYYGFQRLKLMRDHMDGPDATDLYWTVNVSGLITNLGKPITDVLDDEYDLWMCKDVHGINWANFIFRNSRWSRDFLDFIIALEPMYRNDPWKEQRTIGHHWMHERWTYKINLLSQRQLQSFRYTLYPPWNETTPGHWRKGDLCIQFPGVTLEDRIKYVSEMLADGSIIR